MFPNNASTFALVSYCPELPGQKQPLNVHSKKSKEYIFDTDYNVRCGTDVTNPEIHPFVFALQKLKRIIVLECF